MNEILYIVVALLSLSAVVVAASKGYVFLIACGVLLTLTTATTAGKLVSIFGFHISAATCLFAAIFLLSDVTTEIRGKPSALRLLSVMIVADLSFLAFGTLIASISAATPTPVSDALEKLFSFLPRLMAAGLIAFSISQLLDIFIFAKLRQMTGAKYLWLRNFGSTALSQLVDTIIVWFIAFYGIVPNLWSIIIANYSVKIIASLVSIPFCYAAVKIAKRD